MTKTNTDYEYALNRERLILAATEEIVKIMDREGVTRADLARQMGVSRPCITRWLQGGNLTLGTLADMGTALGCRIDITATIPRNGKTR